MKMQARLVFVVLALLLNVIGSAHAQSDSGEQAVVGIGTSKVRAEGVAASREAAVQVALNMAVDRVLTDVVSPEVMVGQFKMINESVLNRPDQFVRDYKVLTDATVGDTYCVVISATVLVGRLKESLKSSGVRMGTSGLPRVLVCVAERRANAPLPTYWWNGRTEVIENISQAAFSQAFTEAGFPLAPPAPVAVGTYTPELSDAEAVALGRQFQAEVVVVGVASAQEEAGPAGAQAGASAYRATITVRALRVADSQRVAASQKEVSATEHNADGQEALKAAAAQAGQEVVALLNTTWFKKAAVSSRLEIVVKGVGGKIANFVNFRGMVSAIPGVGNVLIKTMMPEQAVLTLSYQGTARTLADAISAKKFEGFTVTLDGVYPESIQVTLVPR